MLTSEGRHFVAEPLTRATTSMDPTSPKSVLAVVPMVVAVVFRTQTGAALIAFAGFVALFVVTYRWALRRAGRAENRISRKLKQS